MIIPQKLTGLRKNFLIEILQWIESSRPPSRERGELICNIYILPKFKHKY